MEYEWNLRQEEMDESDDDLDDKVSANGASEFLPLLPGFLRHVDEIVLRKTVSGLLTQGHLMLAIAAFFDPCWVPQLY